MTVFSQLKSTRSNNHWFDRKVLVEGKTVSGKYIRQVGVPGLHLYSDIQSRDDVTHIRTRDKILKYHGRI